MMCYMPQSHDVLQSQSHDVLQSQSHDVLQSQSHNVSSCLKCLLAERMESMTAAAVTLKVSLLVL